MRVATGILSTGQLTSLRLVQHHALCIRWGLDGRDDFLAACSCRQLPGISSPTLERTCRGPRRSGELRAGCYFIEICVINLDHITLSAVERPPAKNRTNTNHHSADWAEQGNWMSLFRRSH